MAWCNCIGPQGTDPVCPCLMQEADVPSIMSSWDFVFRNLPKLKPRVRVKAVSRPSTPEARNG